ASWLPWMGIDLDSSDAGPGTIDILLESAGLGALDHRIANPRRLYCLENERGELEVIELEDTLGGKVRIYFQRPLALEQSEHAAVDAQVDLDRGVLRNARLVRDRLPGGGRAAAGERLPVGAQRRGEVPELITGEIRVGIQAIRECAGRAPLAADRREPLGVLL